MSKNQDYSTNSPEQVFQLNNNVTVTMNSTQKMIKSEFEPPLKKKKVDLVTIEKVTTNVHNNNLLSLKSACSVCGCRISIIAEDDSTQRKMKKTKDISSFSCQTENHQLLSILDLSNNAKAVKFYTGFKDYEQFMSVFEALGCDKYDLKYYDNVQPVNLSHIDQFLVVLIILKQHKSHYEISIMFNVTLKDIKNIFITWIRFMRLEWSHIKIKKALRSLKKLAILNHNKLQSSNQDCVNVIDVENYKLNSMDRLKTTYKILLNGPANYIESHLVNDIQFVCERLYYLAITNNIELITLKPPTKKIISK